MAYPITLQVCFWILQVGKDISGSVRATEKNIIKLITFLIGECEWKMYSEKSNIYKQYLFYFDAVEKKIYLEYIRIVLGSYISMGNMFPLPIFNLLTTKKVITHTIKIYDKCMHQYREISQV